MELLFIKMVTEMRKEQSQIKKPVYLRFSNLDLSKIQMYKFWYNYVK